MSDYTCALWTWRHDAAHYELFDDEWEAAASAWYLSENGDAAIAGVQFSDGRLVPEQDWEVYHTYGREQMAKEDEHRKTQPKPVKIGTVTEPFEGRQKVNVWDWDDKPPEWLGKQS